MNAVGSIQFRRVINFVCALSVVCGTVFFSFFCAHSSLPSCETGIQIASHIQHTVLQARASRRPENQDHHSHAKLKDRPHRMPAILAAVELDHVQIALPKTSDVPQFSSLVSTPPTPPPII